MPKKGRRRLLSQSNRTRNALYCRNRRRGLGCDVLDNSCSCSAPSPSTALVQSLNEACFNNPVDPVDVPASVDGNPVDPVDVPASVDHPVDGNPVEVREASEARLTIDDRCNDMDVREASVPVDEFEQLAQSFHRHMATVDYHACPMCHSSVLSSTAVACRKCAKDSRFTDQNNMDPGLRVPECLQDLTLAESMLIAQVNPIMTVYRLPRGGQYGTRGHSICFQQDINSFCTSLPRAVRDLDILILYKRRSNLPPKYFRVRRRKVLEALQWLKGNNPLYSDIQINEAQLNALPVNDCISLPADHHVVDNVEEVLAEEGPEGACDVSDETVQSFCPSNVNRQTEREAIRAHLQWPAIDRTNPINELNTAGFFARAFPCLFPTGKADLTSARATRVYPTEYFQHLLNYHDDRFRTDPRFVFYAQNFCDRSTSLSVGNVYARRNPDESALSILQLKQLLRDGNTSIAKKILKFGSNIRGTKQFWYNRSEELTRMLDQLGTAHLFFTFSCADSQWPDLHRFLPGHSNKSAAVAANPFVVDQYCTARFNIFFEVMTPYLRVKDYWYRFEWQHRGSLHVHGMAWTENGLPSDADLTAVKVFADQIVSCNNPAVQSGEEACANFFYAISQNPASLDFNTVVDKHADLCELVNGLQRHCKCTPYCLRTKPDGSQYCRFKFPVPTSKETVVTRTMPPNEKVEIAYQRNDGTVNHYNPFLLRCWRGNMDISVIADEKDCARYVAKYTTKGEPFSQSYVSVYRTLVTESLSDDDSFARSAQKLLLQTVGNRDRSIQECCHLISGAPLYHCSRAFVVVSYDGESILEDITGRSVSAIIKYMQRPAQFENLSFAEVMKSYTLRKCGETVRLYPRATPAVVRFMPSIDSNPEGPSYERYCKQQLVFHVPFRNFSDLWNRYPTVTEAANRLVFEQISQHANHAQVIAEAARELTEEDFDLPVTAIVDEFTMGLADLETEELPHPVVESTDSHDWTDEQYAALLTVDVVESEFIAKAKLSHQPQSNVRLNCDPDSLNDMQRLAYNTVMTHHQSISRDPMFLIVSGTAGTGKSYLMHCVSQYLGHECKLAAPTGVAALNISGQTVHSLLHFSSLNQFKDLSADNLSSLQEHFSSVRYIIIDEMSMIGLKMLGAIDQRLRQAVPSKANAFFGGMSVVLMGDFGQLPPVGDTVLYSSMPGSGALSMTGFAAFSQFRRYVRLERPIRQAGDEVFSDILQRLRNGDVTWQDYQTLSARFVGTCSDVPLADTPHLFPDRASVCDHNLAMLRAVGNPIASIEAENSSRAAAHFSADVAGGLENHLALCCEARVMLRSNLWTDAGLVNGSIGIVKAICYLKNDGPPALPDFVIVCFDNYTGPAFITQWPKSVPICPVQRCWRSGNRNHSRKNFPLSLAWAMTVHKAQGLTLNRAVVNVGSNERSSGLSFVALSRVRCMTDVFLCPFPFSRWSSLGRSATMKSRRQFERKVLEE